MRRATSMFLTVAFSASGLAVASGVRPVTGSRRDHTLTAITESGQTYLAGRELQVDLDFPSGKSAKGKLFILFEPSKGLFLQACGWEQRDYPAYAWMDDIKAYSRVGVTADRIFMVSANQAIVVVESVEKANSLDDAEAKSLQLVGDHLAETEARKPTSVKATSLMIDRSDFPDGFFRGRYDPMGLLRVKLADMVWQGGEWDLTLESMDTHRQAKLRIIQQGSMWFLRK